jgi:tetratricopeptide (TPR) repeat protein
MAFVSTVFSAIFFLAPFFSQNGDASFYFQKGTIEFDQGMYSFAEENLTRAASLDPSLHQAYNMLGDIRILQKRHHDALTFYGKSLEINDAQDSVHFKAGEIEDYFVNNAKALSHFQKACELNPLNVYAAAGAGRILSLEKRNAEAEHYYTQSINAGRTEEEKMLKNYRAASKKKDFYGEEFYLSGSIKANPADSAAYYLLASIHRSHKNNKKAAAVLEKLKFIRPNEEKVYVLLSHIYYSERIYKNRKQEIETAISYMQTVLTMSPSNTEHLEFMAELQRAAGNEEKARLFEDRSRTGMRIEGNMKKTQRE